MGWIFLSSLVNNLLGEEFLFRGVLLPKMEGVFGKWDWVANGVMFGAYHLHMPWSILSNIIFGVIAAFSGKRFHTNWFPIILHNGQVVYLLILILGSFSGRRDLFSKIDYDTLYPNGNFGISDYERDSG